MIKYDVWEMVEVGCEEYYDYSAEGIDIQADEDPFFSQMFGE